MPSQAGIISSKRIEAWHMISVELCAKDLAAVKSDVNNIAGSFFAGTSPLIRPFLDKLQHVLPTDQRGFGMAYSLGALRSHVDSLMANESVIRVECQGRSIDVSRDELEVLINAKYPSFRHENLNLAGLLFLQSGPALQSASVVSLRRDHKVMVPDGRRTQRYIFHMTVVSLDANRASVRIEFDLDRLPGSLQRP